MPLAKDQGDFSGSPIPHPPGSHTPLWSLVELAKESCSLLTATRAEVFASSPRSSGPLNCTKKEVSYSLSRHKHVSHLPLSDGPESNELTALSQQLEAFASFERRAREVGGVPGLSLSSDLSPPTHLYPQVELWLTALHWSLLPVLGGLCRHLRQTPQYLRLSVEKSG